MVSEVVDLTLDYKGHDLPSEGQNRADCTHWTELLGSFGNVNTLRVHNGLVRGVFHSLQLNRGPALEILPELKELVCLVGSTADKTIATFIQERVVVSKPVNLIGEDFLVGHIGYRFLTLTGYSYVDPNPVPK